MRDRTNPLIAQKWELWEPKAKDRTYVGSGKRIRPLNRRYLVATSCHCDGAAFGNLFERHGDVVYNHCSNGGYPGR